MRIASLLIVVSAFFVSCSGEPEAPPYGSCHAEDDGDWVLDAKIRPGTVGLYDLNRDGRDDLLYTVSVAAESNALTLDSDYPRFGFATALATGEPGMFGSTQLLRISEHIREPQSTPFATSSADVDGDGRRDLLVRNYGTRGWDDPNFDEGSNHWLYLELTDRGPVFRALDSFQAHFDRFGDFDGDGIDDVLTCRVARPDSESALKLVLGPLLTSPSAPIDVGLPCVSEHRFAYNQGHVADYDRDGRLELAYEADDHTPIQIRFERTGDTAVPVHTSLAGGPRVESEANVYGDFDGDGLVDVLSTGEDDTLIIRHNLGGEFEIITVRTANPVFEPLRLALERGAKGGVASFDLDPSDAIYFADDAVGLYIYRAQPTFGQASGVLEGHFAGPEIIIQPAERFSEIMNVVGDHDGDGRQELLAYAHCVDGGLPHMGFLPRR